MFLSDKREKFSCKKKKELAKINFFSKRLVLDKYEISCKKFGLS